MKITHILAKRLNSDEDGRWLGSLSFILDGSLALNDVILIKSGESKRVRMPYKLVKTLDTNHQSRNKRIPQGYKSVSYFQPISKELTRQMTAYAIEALSKISQIGQVKEFYIEDDKLLEVVCD